MKFARYNYAFKCHSILDETIGVVDILCSGCLKIHVLLHLAKGSYNIRLNGLSPIDFRIV